MQKSGPPRRVRPMACAAPEEGDMRGYSTKLVWRDGDWWVSLLKDGQEVAFMSLDEWKQLGATQQAMEVIRGWERDCGQDILGEVEWRGA